MSTCSLQSTVPDSVRVLSGRATSRTNVSEENRTADFALSVLDSVREVHDSSLSVASTEEALLQGKKTGLQSLIK